MDEPRSVTLNTTLAICAMIAAALFAAKTAFAAPGFVWLAGGLWLGLAVTAALAQSSAGGRDYLFGTLRTRHYTQVYRFVARPLNDWVWRRVGRMQTRPDGTEAPPPETTRLWPLLRAALTWRLLDRALFIAAAYPVVALMLPWLLASDAVLGAGVVVFPAVEFWPERAAVVALVVLLTAGLGGLKLALRKSRRFYRNLVGWALLFVFAYSFAIAFAVSGAIAFAGLAAVALAFAYTFSGLGAFAGLFAFSFSVAFTAEVAFQFAFATVRLIPLPPAAPHLVPRRLAVA